jgi:hypothetical protein
MQTRSSARRLLRSLLRNLGRRPGPQNLVPDRDSGDLLSGDEASSPDYGSAVEYLRDLESGLRYWYQAAEIKAQVVLAISGALVAVLGGSLLGNRDDVARTVAVLGQRPGCSWLG